MMIRWYLLPFSLIYGLITSIRNILFQQKILPEKSFSVPIISVGNLSVGGTGKSPLVHYLVDQLSSEIKIAILSRGYGRKTQGYRITNYHSSYLDVGDEAIQLFLRFKNKIVVAVCENRVLGIEKLVQEQNPDIIILDDAFQHRYVKPSISILTSDYSRPFWRDFLLPAGNLRESRRGMKRTDIIMVTKCPPLLPEKEKLDIQHAAALLPHQKLFFSSVVYNEEIIGFSERMPDNNLAYYKVLLITGIAKADAFLARVKDFAKEVHHMEFPDHHHFSKRNVADIVKAYKNLGDYALILTTEKDYVRLKLHPELSTNLYYWPIEIVVDEEEEFLAALGINKYI